MSWTNKEAKNIIGGVLGSLPYQSAANTTDVVAPNITTTKLFYSQTGTGTVGAAPVLDILLPSDLPLSTVSTVGGVIVPSAGFISIDVSGNISIPQSIDINATPTFASEFLSADTNQLVLGTTNTTTITQSTLTSSRTFTLPDADSNSIIASIQPIVGSFATGIGSDGIISYDTPIGQQVYTYDPTVPTVTDTVKLDNVLQNIYNFASASTGGLIWKTGCVASSVSNLSLTGSTPLVVDGITLADTNRLLLTAQTTGSANNVDNGIYVVSITGGSYSLARSTDMDTWAETVGAAIVVSEGTTYAGSTWLSTTAAGGTLGTTPILFDEFGISFQPGTGINITGNQISVSSDVPTSIGNLSPLFTTSNSSANTYTFTQVSQNANLVYSSPNGSTGVPTFRSLVPADLPAGTSSARGVLQVGTNLSVTTGTISVATGSSSTLGVVKVDGTTIISTTGTLSVGTVPFSSISGVIPVTQGGTGQTTYTNGQLLIGNTTGNTLAKATLTGTTDQVIVTNGASSITLSLPQSINTTSSPTFAAVTATTFTGALSGNATTATSATDIGVTNNSTAASFYIPFINNNITSSYALQVDSGLSYNPSTNVLTATTFTGALSGNATTATTTTNLSGTTAKSIPYQTSSGSTAYTAVNSTATKEYLQQVSSGNPTFAQIAFADISGTSTIAQVTIANQSISASAIDWSTGNCFTKTLGANTTFTFSNTTSGQVIVVTLTQDTTTRTVTWPTVKWTGGIAPVMSTGSGAIDTYTFINTGSFIVGSYVQNVS